MSLAIEYGDVLSEVDVIGSSLRSQSDRFGDEDFDAVASQIIHSTSQLIDEYLHRRVICRRYNVRIMRHQWRYDPILEQYRAWSPVHPVVEVETSGVTSSYYLRKQIGAALIDPHEDQWVVTSNPVSQEIDLFAGYKRRGQLTAQLKTEAGSDLTDLTEDPPTIPEAIRGFAIEAVFYFLARRAQGVAQSSRQLQSASAVVTVDQVDQAWFRAEADRRIHAFKVLQCVTR